MEPIVCINCGASLTVDDTKQRIECRYCGSTFNNPHYQAPQRQTPPPPPPVNNLPPRPTYRYREPYPQVNAIILIIGLLFYFVPGIIYYNSVKQRQRAWHRRYNRR